MKYSVNKETKIVELLSEVFTTKELLDLIGQFDDYTFLISPKIELKTSIKLEKQGMVVGANYISIIGNTEHS